MLIFFSSINVRSVLYWRCFIKLLYKEYVLDCIALFLIYMENVNEYISFIETIAAVLKKENNDWKVYLKQQLVGQPHHIYYVDEAAIAVETTSN